MCGVARKGCSLHQRVHVGLCRRGALLHARGAGHRGADDSQTGRTVLRLRTQCLGVPSYPTVQAAPAVCATGGRYWGCTGVP